MYGSDYSTLPLSPNSSACAPNGDPYELPHQNQQVQQSVAEAYSRASSDSVRPSYTPSIQHVSAEGRDEIAASERELLAQVSAGYAYDYLRSNVNKAADYLAKIIKFDKTADGETLKGALRFLDGGEGFSPSVQYNAARLAKDRFWYGLNDPGTLEKLSRCLQQYVRVSQKNFIIALGRTMPKELINSSTMEHFYDAAKSYVCGGGSFENLQFDKDMKSSMACIDGYLRNKEVREAVDFMLAMPRGERKELLQNDAVQAGSNLDTLVPGSQSDSRKRASEMDPSGASKRTRLSMQSQPVGYQEMQDHMVLATPSLPDGSAGGRWGHTTVPMHEHPLYTPFYATDHSTWRSAPYPMNSYLPGWTDGPGPQWPMVMPPPATDEVASTVASRGMDERNVLSDDPTRLFDFYLNDLHSKSGAPMTVRTDYSRQDVQGGIGINAGSSELEPSQSPLWDDLFEVMEKNATWNRHSS